MKKKQRDYGLLFAILSPICSSIATIFLSGATKLLSPFVAASIGGILGGVILLVILLVSREKQILKRVSSNIKDLTAMTILRPVVGTLIFTIGLSLTDAIKAIFFTKVEPYFVLLSHWIIQKEKIKPRHVLLLAIHIVGAFLLSTGGEIGIFGKTQIGDILIILAMAIFSLSYIYGARLSRNMGARTTNAITMLAGGIILLPLVLVFSSAATISSPTGWGYFVAYVVIFNVIGLTMWYASLKNVKGWMVSALRAVGPLVGVPVALLLFNATLSAIQIIGAITVLVTSILIAREHKK